MASSCEYPYLKGSDGRQVDPNSVVISGMSGLFPECNNVKEFTDLLYNKIDPMTTNESRWSYKHAELVEQSGKVPGLDKFDAQFFTVNFRLSSKMDCVPRKLLEQTYQAIFDAGISPDHLSGKKVAVYAGAGSSEGVFHYLTNDTSGLGLLGCTQSHYANRISYWLNLKGPSLAISGSCVSTVLCLEKAYELIESGECEAAIIGVGNTNIQPQSFVHYGRMIPICKDGKTKSFDKNSDGFAISEAIGVLFLQKAKDAKRIYAEVCCVASEFVPQSNDIHDVFGSIKTLAPFLEEYYLKLGISPNDVEYIEAFGSAIPEADKNELEAISNVFCKNRKNSLLVGSVMSNIGYTAVATGFCSIVKVLIAYQKGEIAGNVHCENPREDVIGIQEDKVKILTENAKFSRSYVGVNNFSYSGANSHVLLRGFYKKRNPEKYHSNIPRLVTASGRHEASVIKIFDDLKSRPVDPEEVALLYNFYNSNVRGHLGRGYCILDTNSNETVCLSEKVEYHDIKRPLWFVYSGMGSQWVGMGAQLMKIPLFAAAIKRCDEILKPKGLDIVNIITTTDASIFDNILHTFVGIAAIQIGLTDIFKALGVIPDKIIGHSVGELGCAYADNCFTAEEMILSAYSRGLVSLQTSFIKGSMAAVGVGYQRIQHMCPPEIEVACHNSPNSCTISGPAEAIKEFAKKLTDQSIFVREVPCCNIAYHSRYIKEAGPGLLTYLNEIIKTPKERSEKWISTSVPQRDWNKPIAKYSSAEYHTNNLLNPVLFEEILSLVPHNAVLVEIAPHSLLQAILKKTLPQSCLNISLTRRGNTDSILLLLQGIGELYLQGQIPQLAALYPAVEFPVSTATPMLSHLVGWAHDDTWSLPLFVDTGNKKANTVTFVISPYDDEYRYLTGYGYDSKAVFPFSLALVCVWDMLAMSKGSGRRKLSVQFQDLIFFGQPSLSENGFIRLNIQVQTGNGYFEVTTGSDRVITGYIHADATRGSVLKARNTVDSLIKDQVLPKQDVYKLFCDKGYHYSPEFKCIENINTRMTNAELTWNDNWVTFIDGLIQMSAIRRDHDGISEVKSIRRIYIDMPEHLKEARTGSTIVASINDTGCLRAGGVTMEDLDFFDFPVTFGSASLKGLTFIPHFNGDKTDVSKAIGRFLQVVSDSVNRPDINVFELNEIDLFDFKTELMLSLEVYDRLKTNYYSKSDPQSSNVSKLSLADIVVFKNFSIKDKAYIQYCEVIPSNIFVISIETQENVLPSLAVPVASAETYFGKFVLYRWRPPVLHRPSTAIAVNCPADLKLLHTAGQNLQLNQQLTILVPYPMPREIKDFIQEWKTQFKLRNVVVASLDTKSKQSHLPELHLVFNVLKNGIWGGDYYEPIQKAKSDVVKYVSLKCESFGDLDTLYWEGKPSEGSSDVEIDIHYAAINVRDARRASNNTKNLGSNKNLQFGMDFSGITKDGQRVMGLVPTGSATTKLIPDTSLLWPVPKKWTLEEAATVPLAYTYAYYCLAVKSKLMPGMSILVHGATGAFGQAVISLALAFDCTVYATVSNLQKKRFLRKLFPAIPENRIGDSKEISFADMVMSDTKGKGCDIIIGCVSGNLKNVSLSCTASTGVTLDINQISSLEEFEFGMYNLTLDRNYIAIDISSIFYDNHSELRKQLQLLVSNGISQGFVRPLSRVIYDVDDVAKAFRLLSTRRHCGRVLLRLQGKALRQVTPRLTLSSLNSYLVCAGSIRDDVLVMKLIHLLISRGATNITLQMENKYNFNPYMQYKIRKFQELGVNIEIETNQMDSIDTITRTLQRCNQHGSLAGLFVVDNGSQNSVALIEKLDSVSRSLCPNLRFFVIADEDTEFSKNICARRVFDNLPATSLSIGNLSKGIHILDDSMSYATAMNAIEISLTTKSPSILIQPQTPKSNLRKIVERLTGIDVSKMRNSNTLECIGVSDKDAEEISKLFNKNAKIHIEKEEVLKLTKSRIYEIDTPNKSSINVKDKGLNELISFVDSKELLASLDLVYVPTIVHKATGEEKFLCDNDDVLIIFPGLEGHYNKFNQLCEGLKLAAVVVQPGIEYPNESISEMAQRLVKKVFPRLKLEKSFQLLGYSFGVLVALEVAAILEQRGLRGTVYCLDASPDTYCSELNSIFQNIRATNKSELQNKLIEHYYQLQLGIDSEELTDKLKNTFSWTEKVELYLNSLRGKVTLSKQYSQALIETMLGRLEQVQRYKPLGLLASPLASQLVVMQCTRPHQVPRDLGLSRYTLLKPIVYQLKQGNALEDLQCTNIVNRHLSEKIKKAFLEKNICDDQIMNTSKSSI